MNSNIEELTGIPSPKLHGFKPHDFRVILLKKYKYAGNR